MTLQEICANALLSGRGIDLTGCDYGPHKRTNLHLGVQPYYYFLAGLVRSLGLKKILEIGTSFGGSALAMSRGCDLAADGVKLVTVDKVAIAGEAIVARKEIERLVGNSLDARTLARVCGHLKQPIDLLYIDSKHSREHVLGNIESYGRALAPRWIVLDDVRLNEEMEGVWSELKHQYGERACDVSDLVDRGCGFGVLAPSL